MSINENRFKVKSISNNYETNLVNLAQKTISSLVFVYSLKKENKVRAIGSLYELQNQSFVLQDISFNVIEPEVETRAISALCLDTFKSLRSSVLDGNQKITSGFGFDSFQSPKSFYPGISSYYEDGGHSAITFSKSKNPIDKGNGLQYIKIGTDVLRLSKGIEKGIVIHKLIN
jgi:hypothetical protein